MNFGAGPGVLREVDVYLLPKRNGEHVLHGGMLQEEPAGPNEENEENATSTRKFLRTLKEAYEGLTSRRHQRELLLKSLGDVELIRIFYPSSLEEHEARRIYEGLLRDAIERHKKWMVVDAAAVPVAAPLSLIPGPNILLGYLAWRSVTHYKTKKASERARELTIELVPNATLSELGELVRQRFAFRRKERIRAFGKRLGLPHLANEY